MAFEKKILVLKQLEKGFSFKDKTVSGIARIELENGVAEFYLSLINLCPASNGEYYVFVLDGNNKLFPFFIGKYPEFSVKTFSFPPNLERISVGVVAVDNYIPITVAFSTTYQNNDSLKEFKKSVIDYLAQKHRADTKKEDKPEQIEPKNPNPEKSFPEPSPIKPPYPPAPSPDPNVTPPDEFNNIKTDYNDEAVATENYFEFDSLEDKLNKIKELDNEYLQFENELLNNRCKEKTQESATHGSSLKDETDLNESKKSSEKPPYFLSVRGELEDVFLKFPKETELPKIFSESRWAKVYYSDTKYYVVGLVFEEHKEKYICYGVPGTYSKDPPKELKGFCSFIPLSIFSL